MTRLLSVLVVAALAASASVANAQAVAVKLSEWKVELSRDTVVAGSVTFRVNNAGTVSHMFYVRGEGVDKGTREIPVRQSATLVVTVKPGTYEVFCSMSDESHKLAGMKRTLVVIPADPTEAPKKPDEGKPRAHARRGRASLQAAHASAKPDNTSAM